MLKARVVTALILLAGLLSSLFLLPALGWLLFASLVCGGAALEWGAMVGFGPAPRRVYAVLLGLLCLAGGLVAGLHLPASVAPFALARDNGLPILVYALDDKEGLMGVLSGKTRSTFVGIDKK